MKKLTGKCFVCDGKISALIFLIIISFEHFFKHYARITNGNRN